MHFVSIYTCYLVRTLRVREYNFFSESAWRAGVLSIVDLGPASAQWLKGSNIPGT